MKDKKDWEKKLMKEWNSFIEPINGNDEGTSLTPKGIADWWILKFYYLFEQAKEELRQDLIKKVEGMKIRLGQKNHEVEQDVAYNHGVDDIIKILEE